MAKQPNTCQQVIDDRTKQRCGKPAQPRIGLFALLCDECAEKCQRILERLWGIELDGLGLALHIEDDE